MAEGTAEAVRAITQLTTALIEAMTRLSIAMVQRRARRLREAARQGEYAARAERARLARHHAADKAIWQRTANPVWWRKATPEQIAQAWRAASTWHQVDPDAAATRHVIAQRLQRRGVDVLADRAADPGDARWLHTALQLAQAEREEQIAFAADTDTDTQLADHLLWDPDELPRDRHEVSQGDGVQSEAGKQTARTPVRDGKVAPSTLALATLEAAEAADTRGAPAQVTAAQTAAARTAVATEPNLPHQLSTQAQEQMATMLRQAYSGDPDRAGRILADAAWPTLAASMHRLHWAGKDVPGLLAGLDTDTTASPIPAVTTAWALRTAAAGPLARQRAIQSRQMHQARLERVRDQARPQPVVLSEQDNHDNTGSPRPADTEAQSAARLLNTAFPTSTRQALGRQRPADAGQRSATVRGRGQRTQRDLAAAPER